MSTEMSIEAPWSELLGWNTLELSCLDMFQHISSGENASHKQTLQNHGENKKDMTWLDDDRE